MDNFDITPSPITDKNKPNILNIKPPITVSDNQNFKIKNGFDYVKDNSLLVFSISENLIDFGELSPTNPIIRTNRLEVSGVFKTGYSIFANQDNKLFYLQPNISIPNTTCDDGICSEKTTSNWSNILTYGFGYRCDNLEGKDCAADFLNPSYYKRFSDRSLLENPQSIIKGIIFNKSKKSQITYKVNISGTQQAGVYNNTITYIAAPNF
ncbi:MAG: hypothetical protein Q7K55_09005 [Candidatus Levybacteria bacterium]|nr:hypothetical protein [Candidatus Levybacteria bacterium]